MFALIELYGRTVQSVYTNIYSQVQLWKYIIVSELKRNKFILVALLEVTLFRVYIFFITRQIISPNYLQKICFFLHCTTILYKYTNTGSAKKRDSSYVFSISISIKRYKEWGKHHILYHACIHSQMGGVRGRASKTCSIRQ